MFSFGLLLLYAIDPRRACQWYADVANLRKAKKGDEYAKGYRTLYEGLLRELKKRAVDRPEGKRYSLISRLLDLSPEQRPSAEEALAELKAALPATTS